MKIRELILEEIHPKIKIVIPVGLKDDTFRQFRALGFPVVDDRPGPENQWIFVINNKFKTDTDKLEELLRSRLNHTGRLSVGPA